MPIQKKPTRATRFFPVVLAGIALTLAAACAVPAGPAPAAVFAITYNGNGNSSGVAPTDARRYAAGEQATVAVNTGNLARTGYNFAGWNIKADASGTTYQPGAAYTVSASATLYARWTVAGSSEDYTRVFVENTALPQAVRDYYRPAYGLSGSALKAKLKDIITTSHAPKNYAALWTLFKTADLIPGTVDATYTYGKVWDMYSSTKADGSAAPYWFKMVTNQDTGSGSTEGTAYNREHTWPKVTFGGDVESVPGADGHHVAATDKVVNSLRSDHPYGEVATATNTTQNGSKLGSPKSTLNYTGTDTKVFEPIDCYKGDLARMHFYMSLRYYQDPLFADCDWAAAGAKLKPWYDAMLQRWDDADPVSAKETARNAAVAAHQGNRNPFIDYPELAEMVDLRN